MKKIFLFYILVLFFSSGALAVNGVSPVLYEVDFEPGLEKNFVFEFVISGLRIVNLEVEGDLSEYVKLNTGSVAARQKVNVNLKLPEELGFPGRNDIRIVAGDTFGIIRVNVPYPEKFVELDLIAPDTNIGEVINIKLHIFNKGEDVLVSPILGFYKIHDDEKQISNVMSINDTWLTDYYNYDLKIVAGSYSAGEYLIEAVVEYEDYVSRIQKFFRVGEKRVEVINYTQKLKEGRLDRFNLGVRSFWNSDINSLYMDVKIAGREDSFVSTPIKLKKWDSSNLFVFFDTRGLSAGSYNLEVTIYFDGDFVVENVSILVYEGFDLIFILVIIGSLISIFAIFLMWNRFKKSLKEIEEEIGPLSE